MTEARQIADLGLRSLWAELNIVDIEEQAGSSRLKGKTFSGGFKNKQ